MGGGVTRRAEHLETLHEYFRLLEQGDLDGWSKLWEPNCLQLVPYAADPLPTRIEGRDGVRELYKSINEGFRELAFTEVHLHPLHDPDAVFARWFPRCVMLDGSIYTNESVGIFRFEPTTGRIAHFTEYFCSSGFVDNYEEF